MPDTTAPIKREKLRDSNIELLRIVAMLLVMIVHASFLSLSPPTQADAQGDLPAAFFRCLSQSLSIICVDVFVLISGWFAIKVKLRRITEFVFQAYFFGMLMYVVAVLRGMDAMSATGLGRVLLSNDMWFVRSYLVLYIFAPVLNAFVERSGRGGLGKFLVAFFVIQTLHGCVTGSSWFAGGYSPLSFMGLYMLGRYVRLYPCKLTQMSRTSDLAVYLCLAVGLAAVMVLSIRAGHEAWQLYLFSSPLVILESLYFFLFFTKVRFHSRAVNWVAVSSFAVYLFHCDVHFLQPVYAAHIQGWYQSCPTVMFLLRVAIWIAAIFALSILIDKLRILAWGFCLRLWGKVARRERRKKQL